MTVADVITNSVALCGARTFGEGLSPIELTELLAALNMMIDSWTTERLITYAIARNVYTVPIQEGVTIGPGATINVLRPLRIEKAALLLNMLPQPMELPLEVLNKDQYADIIFKGLPSTYAAAMWDDRAFPVATLHFYPVPTQSNQLVLYTWTVLTQFNALTDVVLFPPGYLQAITYNFALMAMPRFSKELPSKLVVDEAAKSKGHIKSLNLPDPLMKCDQALLGNRGGMNIWTGRHGR